MTRLSTTLLLVAALALPSTGRASAPDTSSTAATPALDLTLRQEPDWEGLKVDTQLFLLYQVGIVGIIYLLPESVSQWDEEAKGGNPFKKWNDNVTGLQRDTDKWVINYVMHPYFGATYYVRARNRGFDRRASFWYSVAMSTLYEYGIEAIFEPASVQDMIFTPVGGAVVGEYFMIGREKIRARIARRGHATFWDKTGLFLTDPIGVINEKVMGMLGRQYNARLELQPVVSPALFHDDRARHDDAIYGLRAQLTW